MTKEEDEKRRIRLKRVQDYLDNTSKEQLRKDLIDNSFKFKVTDEKWKLIEEKLISYGYELSVESVNNKKIYYKRIEDINIIKTFKNSENVLRLDSYVIADAENNLLTHEYIIGIKKNNFVLSWQGSGKMSSLMKMIGVNFDEVL